MGWTARHDPALEYLLYAEILDGNSTGSLSDESGIMNNFNYSPSPHAIKLWRIFKGLRDGLAFLQEGAEMTSDPWSGRIISLSVNNWNPIVHLDIKPNNSKLLSNPRIQ